jgi:hypothetical protein
MAPPFFADLAKAATGESSAGGVAGWWLAGHEWGGRPERQCGACLPACLPRIPALGGSRLPYGAGADPT